MKWWQKTNWLRWLEFFEDDNSRFSMTRGITLLAFFASYDIIKSMGNDDAKVNALYVFIPAFVLNSVGNKVADKFGSKKTINIQNATTENLTKEGDVSVSNGG